MKPQYTIATNKYGHYCIPLSSAHRPCAQTILAGDVHEPDTIRFILDNCGDGDVIHAGAYFGDMLPALSQIKGRCWAFEPSRNNWKCADITCMLNDITVTYETNLKIFHGALAEREYRRSRALIIIDRQERSLGGGSRLIQYPSSSFIDKTEKIPLTSIDFFISESIFHFVSNPSFVSIIHLDIEGSEQLALTGAMDTITRCKPILILETLPDIEWMNANLFSIGYKHTGRVHSNSILECVK